MRAGGPGQSSTLDVHAHRRHLSAHHEPNPKAYVANYNFNYALRPFAVLALISRKHRSLQALLTPADGVRERHKALRRDAWWTNGS